MAGLKFYENHHGDFTATEAQTGLDISVFRNVGAPGEHMWMWTIRSPSVSGGLGKLLATGEEPGQSDDSRREAMRQAKMALGSIAPTREGVRKNPGTAQLEAAVAAWAKKHRRNPMAGLSAAQAAEFLRYAREHDRKYDQHFATGPSVYQTCEETARGIIMGKPVASSRKPWPPRCRRDLLDQFSDNEIPEAHFIRDEVEHGS